MLNELKQVNRKIRVLYLITSLDYGGTQKQLYYILRNLPEAIEPIVISLKKYGRFKRKIKEICRNLYDLSLPSKSKIFSLCFLPYAFFKLYFLILKLKPNVVHAFLFQANLFSKIVKFFFPKIRVICSERVAEKEKMWQLKISRYTNFLADIIVVNSIELKEFVLKYQKVKQQKVVVIPNMIDLDEIKFEGSPEEIRNKLSINDKTFVVLSAGRLHKQKGFDFLIEIVDKFVRMCKEKKIEENFLFLVIGDGEDRNKLRELIIKKNLSNYIQLLGYKHNIYDYINICDLFILTSYWEGSPNVVLEALAFNKPVISTEVEGVAQYLKKEWLVSLDNNRLENYTKKLFDIYLKYLNGEKFSVKDCLSESFVIDKLLPKEVIKKFLSLYY